MSYHLSLSLHILKRLFYPLYQQTRRKKISAKQEGVSRDPIHMAVWWCVEPFPLRSKHLTKDFFLGTTASESQSLLTLPLLLQLTHSGLPPTVALSFILFPVPSLLVPLALGTSDCHLHWCCLVLLPVSPTSTLTHSWFLNLSIRKGFNLHVRILDFLFWSLFPRGSMLGTVAPR